MDDQKETAETGAVLGEAIVIVNVGLAGFADELALMGVDVVQVDWRPPGDGDPALADLLAELGA